MFDGNYMNFNLIAQLRAAFWLDVYCMSNVVYWFNSIEL
jgi:hypothetical protein